jgi:hypothetical protein
MALGVYRCHHSKIKLGLDGEDAVIFYDSARTRYSLLKIMSLSELYFDPLVVFDFQLQLVCTLNF